MYGLKIKAVNEPEEDLTTAEILTKATESVTKALVITLLLG